MMENSMKYHYSAMKFGYNGDLNSDRNRKSISDKWFYAYPDKLSRKPLPFLEECILTAKIIRDNTSLPIHVLLSGGHDSVGVAESFRLAKIPFRAAIAVFDKGLNHHDIIYAFDYCKKFSIPYDTYNLNVEKFWENDLLYYAEPVQCRSPQWLVQNWLIDQVDGYPVLGNGEPWTYKGINPFLIDQNIIGTEFMREEAEATQFNEKWLIHKSRDGCGKFYKYTKELKVSGLFDPVIIQWMKSHRETKTTISLDKYKNEIYPLWFPGIGIRKPITYPSFTGKLKVIKRTDYTGFELISDLDRKYRKILTDMFSKEYDSFIAETYIENLKVMCDGKDFMDKQLQWAIDEIKVK